MSQAVLIEDGDYFVTGHSGAKRTQKQLSKAFNWIAPVNWKNAINTQVQLDADLQLIHDACVHFTGSIPSFQYAGNGTLNVTAAGYYATIGA